MEDNMINITVIVAGRPYPIRIAANEEPAIRKVAKLLNDKINQFQLKHSNIDKQDCLSMTLLTYARELHQANQNNTEQGVKDEIKQIQSILNSSLEKNELF